MTALLVYVVAAVAAWFTWCAIGAAVYVRVDRDGSLLEWYKAGPLVGQLFVLTAWPLIALDVHRHHRALAALAAVDREMGR